MTAAGPARFVVRRARKRHACEGCGAWIEVGALYLRHVTFPSDGHWDSIGTLPECARCAAQAGRDATEPRHTQ